MRIAEGVEMLELNVGVMTVHPVILFDRDCWTLVDTGMPFSVSALRELARQAGIGDLPLRNILLTHQDIDHIGGLPGILAGESGKPVVYAHPDDAPAIDGRQPFIKLSPERVEQLRQQLPPADFERFERSFLHPNGPNVDRTYADGETLPIAGGVTVIHTPGHTPGHVALYHEPTKTLIAGDAMVVAGGELSGPNPKATPNMEQALESLKKFRPFDVARVVCYHGGLISGNVNERIAELADRP
jgi:glyoxylase-like metal-dependent hydrolase (beta-lactamase superfamily II)